MLSYQYHCLNYKYADSFELCKCELYDSYSYIKTQIGMGSGGMLQLMAGIEL